MLSNATCARNELDMTSLVNLELSRVLNDVSDIKLIYYTSKHNQEVKIANASVLRSFDNDLNFRVIILGYMDYPNIKHPMGLEKNNIEKNPFCFSDRLMDDSEKIEIDISENYKLILIDVLKKLMNKQYHIFVDADIKIEKLKTIDFFLQIYTGEYIEERYFNINKSFGFRIGFGKDDYFAPIFSGELDSTQEIKDKNELGFLRI